MAEDTAQDEALQGEVQELKAKVGEFRENNVKLRAELEGFDGVDPGEYKELKAAQQALDRQELIKSGDVEAAINAALETQKTDFERRVEALQGENADLKTSVRTLTVTDRLKAAALQAGATSESVDDLIKLVQDSWQLDDAGAPVHMTNGTPTLSDMTAGENIGMTEFFQRHAQQKPFYYGASGGGGGEAGENRPTGGRRSISREEFQSGRFSEQIKAGDVVVEGYE